MKLLFLPDKIRRSLLKLNEADLQEIRMRLNYPIKIKYKFDNYYLTESGASRFSENAITASGELINTVIKNLTENSLYAHNEKLRQGYLVSKYGERIGVAGECIFANEIITLKNVTSILIRIPHEVVGCSSQIWKYLNKELQSVLIISPPGFGKTTILKDLIQKYKDKNVAVIDERGELFCKNSEADYIRFSSKLAGLKIALRTLSPDVIAVDELFGEEDYFTCLKAVKSGIRIFATVHAVNESCLPDALREAFDLFVVLKSEKKAGEINYVYDKHNRDLK